MIRLETRLKLRFFAYTFVCFLIGFLAGFSWRAINHKCPTPKAVQNESVTVETETETKTIVRYVEKEAPQDADVDVTVPKQTLTVKVNGETQTFNKSDNEQYIWTKIKSPWSSSPRRALISRYPSSMRHANGSLASASTSMASPLAWSVFPSRDTSADGWQGAKGPSWEELKSIFKNRMKSNANAAHEETP